MEGYLIAIVTILVFLKILFWTCFCMKWARQRQQVILVRRTLVCIQPGAQPSHSDRVGNAGPGTGPWQGAAGPWQGPPRAQHDEAKPQSKTDMLGNSMAAGGFNTSRPTHQIAGPPPPYTPRQEPEDRSKPM